MKRINLICIALTALFITTTATAQNNNVGIGTTTPDASAVLELESTSQGFLPPRFSTPRMHAISLPSEGLMVYNTDEKSMCFYNGTDWVDMNGTIVPDLVIGDTYAGGIIFYLDGTGGGKVCATADLSSGIQWTTPSYQSTTVPGGATSTTDGLANSNAIVAQAGAGSTYAAGLCRAYSATGDGGLNDWYLPSKDELNKLYLNKTVIGGFANNFYWSSTEDDYNDAWLQYFFYTGYQNGSGKYDICCVRAVRAF